MMEKLRGGVRGAGSGSSRDKSDTGSTTNNAGVSSNAGFGLKGLLMVKRKMKGWKQSRLSRINIGSRAKSVVVENTYKLAPDDDTKFDSVTVRAAMEAGVRFFINEKTRYDPKKCAQVSKIMAEDIKTRIKDLNFKRYKVVCNVFMGQYTESTSNDSVDVLILDDL